MPCYAREQKKFQILKTEIEKYKGTMPYQKKTEFQKSTEELYARTKEKLEDHIKLLESLKKRLKEATSAEERERLEKEIAELESEIEKFQGTLEELIELMRDLERRTIGVSHNE